MDTTRNFATLVGAEFSAASLEKIKLFYDTLASTGRLALYKRLHVYYYHGFYRGGVLQYTGDQNEYTTGHVNHFRNILQHVLNMTTSQRPSFEPKATNTDYKSMSQTIVATNVLEYYNRAKNLDGVMVKGTEHGIVFAEGEIVPEWDVNAGDPFMPDPTAPGGVRNQGDVKFNNYAPYDCIRDLSLPKSADMKWRFYRDFVNKYDLAAVYPEATDRIMALNLDKTQQKDRWLGAVNVNDSDLVAVYKFYHDKTPAVPKGRFAVVIDEQAPLIDTALPYKFFPGFRLCPGEQDGSPFGYSISFDLLPLQEAIDILYSIVITNQTNFGVQNITMPDGSNITVQQLINGLNLIKYDPKFGKPEALNLTNTPAEIFNFIKTLENLMETIGGINSVTRGNPEASLKSGAALALVQSMAIQFNSGLQKAYAIALEGVGTALIRILHAFAKTPRMIEIAGRSNRSYMKSFQSSDLESIARVTVDMGNPLSRTTAGKVQMAETLMDRGMLKTPEQYIQVITTGKLEPTIEGDQAELMLIRTENEQMSEGKGAMAAITDRHVLHISEHKVVLASPEARMNPTTVKVTTAHIQEHLNLLTTLSASNPNFLIALGQQPLQPAPNGNLPTVTPPAPGGPPAPAAPVVDATDPLTKEGSAIKIAGMPTNPLTKEKFSPEATPV